MKRCAVPLRLYLVDWSMLKLTSETALVLHWASVQRKARKPILARKPISNLGPLQPQFFGLRLRHVLTGLRHPAMQRALETPTTRSSVTKVKGDG